MSIVIPNILMILTIHHDHLNHKHHHDENEPEEHVLYPLTESLELRDHLRKNIFIKYLMY